MTGRRRIGLGSFCHALVLFTLFAVLAASAFEATGASTATLVSRYIAAGTLLVVTLVQRDSSRITWRQLAGPARLFLVAAWLLLGFAFLSTTWSVAPLETIGQSAVFALLVINLHVHMTSRWHVASKMISDFSIIFWTFTATIVASLFLGNQVGGRLAGLFSNPNSLGLIAAFSLALGLGLTLEHRNASLVMVAAVLVAVALLLSQSRSAALGVALAFVFAAIRRRTYPPVAVIMGCLVAAIAVLVTLMGIRIPVPSVSGRFETTNGQFFGERLGLWLFTLRASEDKPLAGYGFRTGEIVLFDRQYLNGGVTLGASFNSYLQVLLELGYVGLSCFSLIIVAAVWAVWRTRFSSIAGGLAALVLIGLASGITESALIGLGHPIAWLFWFAVAALCASAKRTMRTRLRDNSADSSVLDSDSLPIRDKSM